MSGDLSASQGSSNTGGDRGNRGEIEGNRYEFRDPKNSLVLSVQILVGFGGTQDYCWVLFTFCS